MFFLTVKGPVRGKAINIRRHGRNAAIIGAVLSSMLVTATGAASASVMATHPAPVTMRTTGFVTAHARSVNLRKLPGRPSAKSRPAARLPRSGLLTPDASVSTNFQGINAGNSNDCGGCGPSDVNAATNGTEILEAVNASLELFDNSGGVLCHGVHTLNQLLGSTDNLTDPRVQYDNATNHFSLSVTVKPASSSAVPTMFVASSTEPCGTWIVYRLTFSGAAFGPGTLIDEPMLGQDSQALLFGTTEFDFRGQNPKGFSVFALPKSQVYAGSSVSFPVLGVASQAVPASNAGTPMISSASSYFVSAVPGLGYRLYRMDNDSSPSPTVTLQATIASSFSAPQAVSQPNSPAALDASDGTIDWSPVFDGSRIWFAHAVGLSGFPTTVRFGFISPAANSVTVNQASHSTSSADFNPSIGVGLNPSGSESVFINWAYDDASQGIPVSDTAASFVYSGGPLAGIVGDVTMVTGSSTNELRFGDYSSVAIDPAVADGTCAVTAQQYFLSNDDWTTRLARLCGPTQVPVPDVSGDTVDQATSALQDAGLVAGSISTTTSCDVLPGEIVSTSPFRGDIVPVGSAVRLVESVGPPAICQ